MKKLGILKTITFINTNSLKKTTDANSSCNYWNSNTTGGPNGLAFPNRRHVQPSPAPISHCVACS